jgi:hypothetical protein
VLFLPEKVLTGTQVCIQRGFLMEVEDNNDPALLADELGVSLHALTGLTSTNMMQLLLDIAGTTL